MARLVGDESFSWSGAYLNPLAKELLQCARESYQRATERDDKVLDLGSGHCLWFTWAGTQIQRTLLLLAEQLGLDCADEKIAIRFTAAPQQVADVFGRCLRKMADPYELQLELEAMPWRKFDDFVSPTLLQEAFIHDRLDLLGACDLVERLTTRYPSTTVSLTNVQPLLLNDDTTEGAYFEDDDVHGVKEFEFADGPIDACEFIAFDLETTGLHPVSSRIVEIAAIRFHCDGREMDRFQTLVDPGMSIPSDATRIHGITDDMVRNQPTADDALSRFVGFLGNEPVALVARNASFDRALVVSGAASVGRQLPKLPVLDTLAMARVAFPDAANHRLSTLLELLGRPSTGAHRAAIDAEGVRFLFSRLLMCQPMQTLHQLYERGAAVALSAEPVTQADLPKGFEELPLAIEGRCRIQMLYRGGSIRASIREVVPVQVFSTGGRHYLSAVCGLNRQTKHFRFDRIEKMIMLRSE